jgi:hypothetical protein
MRTDWVEHGVDVGRRIEDVTGQKARSETVHPPKSRTFHRQIGPPGFRGHRPGARRPVTGGWPTLRLSARRGCYASISVNRLDPATPPNEALGQSGTGRGGGFQPLGQRGARPSEAIVHDDGVRAHGERPLLMIFPARPYWHEDASVPLRRITALGTSRLLKRQECAGCGRRSVVIVVLMRR